MNAAQCIHTTASQDSNATHTFSSLPCCLISRIKITSSSSRQQQLALVHTAVQGMQHTAVHTAVPTAVHAAYGSPYTVVLAAVHTAVHIRQCTQQLTAIHIVSANCSSEAPEMGSRWGHLCRFGCVTLLFCKSSLSSLDDTCSGLHIHLTNTAQTRAVRQVRVCEPTSAQLLGASPSEVEQEAPF